MKSFDYLEANSVEEACSLLSQYRGQARVIAGGTDLLVSIRRKLVEPQYVIDISNIASSKLIRYVPGSGLRIGATASLRDVERSPVIREKFPLLPEAIRTMASPPIRNMATLGGNLCNAVPSADTAPPLIALKAGVKAESVGQERAIDLQDFFLAPRKTALQPGEILTEVHVPDPPTHSRGTYQKVRRTSVDIALVGVAVVVTLDSTESHIAEARIVLGAVAPTPIRATKAEDLARGRSTTETEWIEVAAQAAAEQSRPITDIRASADYRREMVKVLVDQSLRKCLALD